MNAGKKTVLILGAGINGCALARELALNGVACWVVDTADLASGATSGSSRLIHGGLRYLEFGDFALVKESLGERHRLLHLAPQFVRPLRLWIPLESRFGGMIGAPGRFFGWRWWPMPQPKHGRGVALVRAGLALYDTYARDPELPKHTIVRTTAATIPVDRQKYRWLGAYSDAQVTFPERLLLAMLEDARQLSVQQGLDFRVFTYSTARRGGDRVSIEPQANPHAQPGAAGVSTQAIAPAAIVNATGAWVDETLAQLQVSSPRLMGGTKGSHVFTFSPRLIQALNGQGIYAEAQDGRPVFITPLDHAVLIGTTDERFAGDPGTALASDREVNYLLDAVNRVLPEVQLKLSDLDFHYSAVRPLPYTDARTPSAISRRHALVAGQAGDIPLLSLVGGKLTTMRSLAEEAAAAVLGRLGRPVRANSRERVFPGGANYPKHERELPAIWQQLGEHTGFSSDSVAAVWQLVGSRAEEILRAAEDRELLPDSPLPCAMVRWSIEHEWVTTLADLVERRLMLLYHQRLTRRCLTQLAQLLAEAGRLSAQQVDAAVDQQIERLKTRYDKQVD